MNWTELGKIGAILIVYAIVSFVIVVVSRKLSSTASGKEAVRHLAAGVPWLLAAMWWLTLMYFVVPRFEEIFTDFGVALPRLTRTLINLSRWCCSTNYGDSRDWWWLGVRRVLIVAFGGGLVVLMALIGRTPSTARLIRRTGLWVLIASVAAAMVGLGQPLIQMFQSLNSGGL